MNSAHEKRLVKQIKRGDSKAFELFIKQYEKLVYHIVYRMLPGEHAVEDICQDVFCKIYENLDRFQFKAKLSTWIATIAHNTCLNYLQKKRALLFDDHSPEGFSLDSLDGEWKSPDSETEHRELAHTLQRAIAALPLAHRTAITLYHLEEMSYQEISEVMNIPEGTVKSHIFRARKELKESLVQQYRNEPIWNT